MPERELRTRDDVENLVIAVPAGGYVRLGEIAEVRRATGPVEITRRDQIKQVIVRSDTAGTNLATGQAAVRAVIDNIDWPAGYTWKIGGTAQQMAEMNSVVKQLLAYAVFLSFLVLAVQFNSLRLPFLVLLAMPFCLAAMGYGLLLAGTAFGATVIIGVMVVLAANVNDAVLLIQTARDRIVGGEPTLSAIRESAIIRMRPRLFQPQFQVRER